MVVSRTRYEECRDEASTELAGVEFERLRVIETYEDPIDLAGVPEMTSTAVTVRITVSQAMNEETLTDTFHALAVMGSEVALAASRRSCIQARGVSKCLSGRVCSSFALSSVRGISRERKREMCRQFVRADARTRTADPFITSEVLYQLSYVGEAV